MIKRKANFVHSIIRNSTLFCTYGAFPPTAVNYSYLCHISVKLWHKCEVYPESIQPFCISREPVGWPWSNLTDKQRRTYCPSVNSYSPVGLVSRQWDTVDWACALCVYLPEFKNTRFDLMMILKSVTIFHAKKKVNSKITFVWAFLMDGRKVLIWGSNMSLRDSVSKYIYFFSHIIRLYVPEVVFAAFLSQNVFSVICSLLKFWFEILVPHLKLKNSFVLFSKFIFVFYLEGRTSMETITLFGWYLLTYSMGQSPWEANWFCS